MFCDELCVEEFASKGEGGEAGYVCNWFIFAMIAWWYEEVDGVIDCIGDVEVEICIHMPPVKNKVMKMFL